MNWTECFINSINYIEDHLLENIEISDIANNSNISPFYFQKAFTVYTGFTVSTYIKNRRLYLSAIDLRSTSITTTNCAKKYGYETVESFTKAFTRFHGASPLKIRNGESNIRLFLPLKINISIGGGEMIDVKIERKEKFTLVGFKKIIKENEGYKECPKFWDEIIEKYFNKLDDNSEISKFIIENNIGEYALCISNPDHKSFQYLIGGLYKGGNIPSTLELIEVSESLWAKFKATGPIPGSLQALNSKIYNDWLPNNEKYRLSIEADIEWYSDSNTNSPDYESEIWLPIKEI